MCLILVNIPTIKEGLSVLCCPSGVGYGGVSREALEGGVMYIHISDLLFCTAEINTTSYSNYMPIFEKRRAIIGIS